MRTSLYHILLTDVDGRLFDVHNAVMTKKAALEWAEIALNMTVYPPDYIPYVADIYVSSKSKALRGWRHIGTYVWSYHGMERVKLHG